MNSLREFSAAPASHHTAHRLLPDCRTEEAGNPRPVAYMQRPCVASE